MKLDLVDTICRLIATPSVNPLGKPASGEEFLEGRLTELLQKFFVEFGLSYRRQSVLPGRENIIARLDGRISPQDGGRVIVFDAHQDTVRVEGMTIDPWEPRIAAGRVYGRGACDTKGSLAAMLWALARLAEERPPGMPTIILVCGVDEEMGFSGIRRLPELWSESALARADNIFPRRPDAAIVGEPTDLQVVVAHKGAVRWRCHTAGRAAHGAMPDRGENAVYRMAKVLPLFERYQAEAARMTGHPLCGGPTLNVGLIAGGTSVNTVPDRCEIAVDLRVPPGEGKGADAAECRRRVIDYIAANSSFDFPVIHEEAEVILRPLADDLNGRLADELLDAALPISGRREKTGALYATHAAEYAAAGIPAVVFGPGSAAQAHTADEWLSLAQLHEAADIFYRFAIR